IKAVVVEVVKSSRMFSRSARAILPSVLFLAISSLADEVGLSADPYDHSFSRFSPEGTWIVYY
ncbi:MAG: hypothetical protein ACE5JA_11060, partial [bacterium]